MHQRINRVWLVNADDKATWTKHSRTGCMTGAVLWECSCGEAMFRGPYSPLYGVGYYCPLEDAWEAGYELTLTTGVACTKFYTNYTIDNMPYAIVLEGYTWIEGPRPPDENSFWHQAAKMAGK